uniref:Dihydrolipoamide acetyltransferase component of pyruvate dehydrogenase complex n=1 Tax=Panagrellus redivivus TaxID=6233 RepID=A0A7E4VLJ0_PANRE
MSTFPAGTAAATMPLKNVYSRAKLTPSLAAAVALIGSPSSSRDLQCSSLIASYIKGNNPAAGDAFLKLRKPGGKVHKIRRYSADRLPDHLEVEIPSTATSSTVISLWRKSEGDRIHVGDVLCELDLPDGSRIPIKSPQDGYLAKIVQGIGSTSGKLLCIVVEREHEIAAFAHWTALNPQPVPASEAIVAPIPGTSNPEKVFDGTVEATPFAKKMASESGVLLAAVNGSGPSGKILAADMAVENELPTSSSVNDSYFDVAVSTLRQSFAKRFIDSKQKYKLTAEVCVDAVYKLRSKFNTFLASGFKLNMEDFFLKAAALASMAVPEANSFYLGSHICRNSRVNLAVSVPIGGGYVSPVILDAHSKGLATIHAELADYRARATRGSLTPDDFVDATFAVSTPEAESVVHRSPPASPKTCTLSIGSVVQQLLPSTGALSGVASSRTLSLTLSYDHRVLDEALGAAWLKAFRSYLETPVSML